MVGEIPKIDRWKPGKVANVYTRWTTCCTLVHPSRRKQDHDLVIGHGEPLPSFAAVESAITAFAPMHA